jgi:hypothetical protein
MMASAGSDAFAHNAIYTPNPNTAYPINILVILVESGSFDALLRAQQNNGPVAMHQLGVKTTPARTCSAQRLYAPGAHAYSIA